MDASYVPAMAALAGSAIGALASLGTSWISQNSQARAVQLGQDRARGEALYGEFIREASKLFGDAFGHEMEDPAKLVQFYAIVGMIRLFGQPRTLTEAEAVTREIGATYFAPNKALRLFADIVRAGELDPLCAFSDACRDELRSGRS